MAAGSGRRDPRATDQAILFLGGEAAWDFLTFWKTRNLVTNSGR